MTFPEFIFDKGVKPLSLAMPVPLPTVYSWTRRKRIPRKHWDRLMALYPKLSFRVLIDMEVESSR